MRAAADLHNVGVAGNQPHAVKRHAQPLGNQLREAGFVALAVGDGAENHVYAAIGVYGDFGTLARRAGRGIDVIRHADATTLAACFCFRFTRGKAGPIAERERFVHGVVIVTAIVEHAERIGVRQLLRFK